MRTPASGGFRRIWKDLPAVHTQPKGQFLSNKSVSSTCTLALRLSTQGSQIECPHGITWIGILDKQAKHVLLLISSPTSLALTSFASSWHQYDFAQLQHLGADKALDQQSMQGVDMFQKVGLEVSSTYFTGSGSTLLCELMALGVTVPVDLASSTLKHFLTATLLVAKLTENLFPSIPIQKDLVVAWT